MNEAAPAPLPPLYESVLGPAELEALFADVGWLEGPVEVTAKQGPRERAETAPRSLEEARCALLAGSVRGVQLRYVHEGVGWCDTLIRVPTGIRLVRCPLPEPSRSR